MKKLLALMLALLMLALLMLAGTALAEMEEGEILLETGKVSLYMIPPENAVLLTRESSASEFNALGLSQRDMVPAMEANDIYAYLVSPEYGWDISLAVYEYIAGDMDDLTEYGAFALCAQLETLYADQGYDVESVEVYLSAGHKYICVRASVPGEDGAADYLIQYFTDQHDHEISAALWSYGQPVDEDTDVMLMELIDSLWCIAE